MKPPITVNFRKKQTIFIGLKVFVRIRHELRKVPRDQKFPSPLEFEVSLRNTAF